MFLGAQEACVEDIGLGPQEVIRASSGAGSEKWGEADARGHGEVTVDQQMMMRVRELVFVTLWKTF